LVCRAGLLDWAGFAATAFAFFILAIAPLEGSGLLPVPNLPRANRQAMRAALTPRNHHTKQ
jgi:hypothetical protein